MDLVWSCIALELPLEPSLDMPPMPELMPIPEQPETRIANSDMMINFILFSSNKFTYPACRIFARQSGSFFTKRDVAW